MSTTAKVTFLAACIASGGLIAYVHYSQAADRERLHEGVRRDVERQRLKGLGMSNTGGSSGSDTSGIDAVTGAGGNALQR
ncbi:protein PET117, mitochondrial-like [Anopheles albimanus]|uniref:Protein pet117 log mitochondrial n=1 Tax=Anopheles albimanus TaxID=7167 RepID=A0A182FR59_ANOAL|nr:protein PET117, mitochondrial-like [Anopheles albimanus]